jgi:hypothetical protein
MTALERYTKLECPAVWRESASARRRDVVVSLGDASLTLSDGRTGLALSHWSLPAVVRHDRADGAAAQYAPGPDPDGETLEIAEPEMIAAIETVRAAIAARRPQRGRVRLGVLAGMVGLVAVLGLVWLPGAVVRHTAGVVPTAKRAEIGGFALADIERLTGPACANGLGERAADRLSDRLFGPGTRIVVLRTGVPGAVQIPGRIMLLDAALVEGQDSPEVAAGHLIAARLRAEAADPLVPLLREAGTAATMRLLATGILNPAAVEGYASVALRPPAPNTPAMDALLERFAVTAVSPGPWLAATGRDEGAAMQPTALPALLPDADWVSLQTICAA